MNSFKKKTARPKKISTDLVGAYAEAQSPEIRAICDVLQKLLDAEIPKATSKIWHGGPVWFIGENPVVGYDVSAKGVKLLFWNGQAFGDDALKPVGKYGAAAVTFADDRDVDDKVIRRWLKKARTNVFDSVGFFKKMREKKKAK